MPPACPEPSELYPRLVVRSELENNIWRDADTEGVIVTGRLPSVNVRLALEVA
jgi:hypothetical protein